MPAKKQPVDTTKTPKTTTEPKVSKAKVTKATRKEVHAASVEETVLTPVETPIVEANTSVTNSPGNMSVHQPSVVEASSTVKKPARRAGRTLLVKSVDGTVSDNQFSFLAGLESVTGTKSNASFFLQFDTVDNAVKAFRQLRTENSNYRMKFSYYRVFFTINGLTETTDYNQIKQSMSNYVESNSGSQVLYSKFYRKDGKFIGCGDLTVDTLQGMNTLLSKEAGFKEFTFETFNGTFYRFNNRREKTDGVPTTA